jgi:hypothetical protein
MAYTDNVVEELLNSCQIVKHAADLPLMKVLKLITFGNYRSSARCRNNFPVVLRAVRIALRSLDKRQCSKFSAMGSLIQLEYFMTKIPHDVVEIRDVLKELGVSSVIGLYESVVNMSPEKTMSTMRSSHSLLWGRG